MGEERKGYGQDDGREMGRRGIWKKIREEGRRDGGKWEGEGVEGRETRGEEGGRDIGERVGWIYITRDGE